MPSLEERVAYLEGRFGEHLQTTAGLRDDIGVLRTDMNRRFDDVQADMNRRFEQVDKRFEQVDKRFEQVDRRFEQVDKRFEQVDRRFDAIDSRFDRMDHRLDGMDGKIDRHFTWLIGVQLAGFLAVFGALVTRYFK